MTPQQQYKANEQERLQQRRIELQRHIDRGEENLLTVEDERTQRALDRKLTSMRNELESIEAELGRDWSESFADFAARQNCEYFRLPNGQVLFENGAACQFQNARGSHGLASRREPPSERFDLLRAQREYWQAKFDAESAEYSRAEIEYTEAASNAMRFPETCPPLPQAAVDCLKAGNERIREITEKIKAIHDQLAESPEAAAQRSFGQEQAGRMRERNDTLQQVIALSCTRVI